MSMIRAAKSAVSMGLMATCASMLFAQDYPNRPIRIVTFGAGGTNDIMARAVGQDLNRAFGQPVIVDNRPAKVVPGQVVSKAPADGYTLLVCGSSFWIGPLLQETPYDPAKDFLPITLISRAPVILVVNPAVAAKSVKELIALAKSQPGKINYASSGTGGSAHLTGELFKSMAGVNVVHVPYKGSGPQMNALLGNESQMMFENPSVVLPLAKTGKLVALGVTSPQQTTLAPGVPTVASSLPGYESVSMIAIMAPAKTPAAVVSRLNQDIGRFLRTNDTKEKFLASGVEPVPTTPQELAALLRADVARWDKVIKAAGIQVD